MGMDEEIANPISYHSPTCLVFVMPCECCFALIKDNESLVNMNLALIECRNCGFLNNSNNNNCNMTAWIMVKHRLTRVRAYKSRNHTVPISLALQITQHQMKHPEYPLAKFHEYKILQKVLARKS